MAIVVELSDLEIGDEIHKVEIDGEDARDRLLEDGHQQLGRFGTTTLARLLRLRLCRRRRLRLKIDLLRLLRLQGREQLSQFGHLPLERLLTVLERLAHLRVGALAA